MKLLVFLFCMFLSNSAFSKPNSNQALADLSVMFFHEPTNPLFEIDKLNIEKMDYSIESLEYVDEYLEEVKNKKKTANEELVLVLRTGAYIGEVLRKNDLKRNWNWLSFEQASLLDKSTFEEYGKSLSTMAVLTDDNTFLFPMGKVSKYLLNGKEDSVKFFVQMMLSIDLKNVHDELEAL